MTIIYLVVPNKPKHDVYVEIEQPDRGKRVSHTSVIAKLHTWQKQLLDERLNDYYQNPTDIMDFDKTIDDIEKSL